MRSQEEVAELNRLYHEECRRKREERDKDNITLRGWLRIYSLTLLAIAVIGGLAQYLWIRLGL